MHEHHRDRLRDKYTAAPESLNEYEIMELLLFYAIPRKNTNEIAHRLIDTYGSVEGVLQASPLQLVDIEGVGKNTANFLSCIGFVTSRDNSKGAFPKIFEYNNVRKPLIDAFAGFTEEVFMTFFLDKKRSIIARKTVYGKDPYKVDLDLKDFSKQIVLIKPTYVAIAHNHFSGHYRPSPDDDKATERICMICALNGAALIDHLIVAGDKVYSYYYDKRLDIIRKKVEDKLT